MKIILVFLGSCCIAFTQAVISEDQAVKMALNHSPARIASDLDIKYRKQHQKTALNLANPEFNYESPTGEFYSLGVSQSFEFPTVYGKRNQLLKKETELALIGKLKTEAEIRRAVKSMYLNIQFTQAMFQQYKTQDSLYTILMDAARRQYTAGQIDYVSHTLTASSKGEIQNQKNLAETDWHNALKQMNRFTGNNSDYIVTPLAKRHSATAHKEPVIFQAVNNSDLKFAEQEIQIHKKSLELEKHKVLPGFSIAYMNQGSHDTPYNLRWRAGISLPIWFWQYDASIKAAKTKVEMSQYQSDYLMQQIENQASQLHSDIQKYRESLEYYEKTGLPIAKEIITSATRMFEAGLYDYMSYLRLLSEAYKIEQKYLETLRQFNQSVIDMEFLNE